MPIHVLPPDVVDQIAAGEVVERPSHLVKELVENSLDAGADRVEIEVSQGGRQIRVTDNGFGLAPDELPLALERHATSKIKTADDLWDLGSFGFRGEALASIAAVSRLKILSRTSESPKAYRLTSEFGRRGEVEPVGGPAGTQVMVGDLFENIPARLKFLKSESAEHVQIRNTVKALALSRHDVEFHLKENDRVTLFLPKTASLKERAEQILEIPLYENFGDFGDFHVHALFSDPTHVAKTSKNIWLFAQSRWIQDRGLMAAVLDSYRSLLMHGEYPQSVIHVTCPREQVDVNIHPTKSQVKFLDPSGAFRAVAACLRRKIEEAPWNAQRAQAPAAPVAIERPRVQDAVLAFSDKALTQTTFAKKDFSFVPVSAQKSPAMAPPAPVRSEPVTEVTSPEALVGRWSSLDVLGQMNLTYIVCQSRDAMVLVDQHAAHERVVFEKLMAGWRAGRIEVQEFLFPLAVDLTPDKVEALSTVADELKKLGLHMEMLGPSTVGVKAGPALLKDSVYAEVLEITADEVARKGGSFHFERIVEHLCATMACHSVVRAGQALSVEQMKSLLRDMDEFPLSGYCPHGRPVSVEWSFHKLERDFGRTV